MVDSSLVSKILDGIYNLLSTISIGVFDSGAVRHEVDSNLCDPWIFFNLLCDCVDANSTGHATDRECHSRRCSWRCTCDDFSQRIRSRARSRSSIGYVGRDLYRLGLIVCWERLLRVLVEFTCFAVLKMSCTSSLESKR